MVVFHFRYHLFSKRILKNIPHHMKQILFRIHEAPGIWASKYPINPFGVDPKLVGQVLIKKVHKLIKVSIGSGHQEVVVITH